MPFRPVAPSRSAELLAAEYGSTIPENPTDAGAVIDELATWAEPGLMAMPSGRFFGWVIGGTLPAALAADWLVSAWDQNAAIRFATPAAAAAEEVAGNWLLDVLDLPRDAGVGFTTGGTMANFVGLAAGRTSVLDDAGWDLNADGLSGSPRITVFVGEERHASIDLALRYLGLGAPTIVAADSEGRIKPEELAAMMAATDGPAIVCLQAGNLHSGAFDPMHEAIEVAHQHGAWVHVDGAFGLWAAVSRRYSEQLLGLASADSWATDAHKTLNVPYDCGIAIVARKDVLQATFGVHTSYLIADDRGVGDPFERVPEFSRRARGITVWAALRSLGRTGTVAMVEKLADSATALARGVAQLPGVEVVNQVAFTQVCLSFGSDERTRRVTEKLIDEATVWMSGSVWQGRAVLRISVSNWSTDDADIVAAIAAVARAMAAVSLEPVPE